MANEEVQCDLTRGDLRKIRSGQTGRQKRFKEYYTAVQNDPDCVTYAYDASQNNDTSKQSLLQPK